MANEEHLAKLREDVGRWNEWRRSNDGVQPDLIKANLIEANLSYANLREVDLIRANLRNASIVGSSLNYANLHEADLTGADLRSSNFSHADLSYASLIESDLRRSDLISASLTYADLSGANFTEADLSYAHFGRADLSGANLSNARLRGADFSEANLNRANLSGADLSEANLNDANLNEANLNGANLSRADFSGANLSGADLSSIKAIATSLLKSDLTAGILTGACIQDWNINNETQLDGVICEYIYLSREWSKREKKYLLSDRRPSSGNFAPGEFALLFQKAFETVDLIFADGIDWKAFFQSFQELRSQYDDDNLSIQAIEKKSGGAFVIRLEVPPAADKAAIESQAKELYERDRQILEAQYRERLNAKDDQIAIYKQQSSSMEEIAKLLAIRPIQLEEPKVTLHPNQLKILQAVHDGLELSSRMPEATDLSIDMVTYYIEVLQDESYLQCMKWHDGLSASQNYKCHLTNKGKVALEDPDHLLPDKGSVSLNQTFNNNDLRGSNIINFANQVRDSASQNASQFSQAIGQNADEITRLITTLREQSQQFPEDQRDAAQIALDDLQQDLTTPEKIEPKRLKQRFITLLMIAGVIGTTIATITDFTNNAFDLAEKAGVPRSELLQYMPTHLLPPLSPP